MGSQAHLQDPGAWRFQLLSLVTIVALLGLVLLLTSEAPADVRRIGSGIGLMGFGVSAAAACRARAIRGEGRRRRSWTLWSLACLSAALGNLGLTLNGAQAKREVISLSDLALSLTLLLTVAAMLSFPLSRRRGTDLARMVLDGVVVGGSILAVASMGIASSVESVSTSVMLVNFVTPVVDITLATLAILFFARGGGPDRFNLGAAAAGFIFFAVADLVYAVTLIEVGQFSLGTPTDLGWITGYALIGWSVRHPAAFKPRSEESSPEVSPVRGTATIFAVFLLSCLIGGINLLEQRVTVATAVIWSVVLLAVLARQFFLVLDNERLRRTLQERVMERTRSLRQVTRSSDLVVASVGDGIYGVDRFGHITFMNPAASEALGYQPGELVGRDAYLTLHRARSDGEEAASETSYISQAIGEGIMTSGHEDVYHRADGRTIPVEVTATPLTDDATTVGAVVVFRDVTQRREVDRLKNEFISMVSHELRTPLTAIRGSLGLLAGGALGPLSADASRMVEIALVSSDRLTRLINDILDLERMEAGALPMELGTHHTRDLVETAMAQAGMLAQEAGVRVRVLRAEGEVCADADRVVQTLLNLLGNAIKFSEPGQEVTVQAVRRGSVVEFEVSDTGRGIPDEKLDAVFARFQQIDSSDAREKGGSGLGLTISRSIVERLGGKIWAANNPEGGAVFRFTLPTAATPATPPAPPTPVTRAPEHVPSSDRSDDDERAAQPVESAR